MSKFNTFTTPTYMVGLEMNKLITSAETVSCSHCGQEVSVWRPATLEDLQIYIQENPTPSSVFTDIIASGDKDFRPFFDAIYGRVARYRDGKWDVAFVNIENVSKPGEAFLAVKNSGISTP